MAHPGGPDRVGQHRVEGCRKSGGIAGGHQHRDISGELGKVPDGGGDKWRRRCHRLEGGQPESLVRRREDDDGSLAIEGCQALVVGRSAEHQLDVPPPRLGSEPISLRAQRTDHRQLRSAPGEAFHGGQQGIEPFARVAGSEAAHPEDERVLEPQRFGDAGVAKLRPRGEEERDAVGHNVDALRVESERVDRLLACRLADRDHRRAASDDRAEQRSIEVVGRAGSPPRRCFAPHLDVVHGHNLTCRGVADHRLASNPMDQMRVPDHRLGEHMRLRTEKPCGTCLAPGVG